MPNRRIALGALSGNAKPAGRNTSAKRKADPEDDNSCADRSKRANVSRFPKSSDTVAPKAHGPIATAIGPASPSPNAAQRKDGELALAAELRRMDAPLAKMRRLEIWSGAGDLTDGNHGAIKFFSESGSQPELVIPFSDIEQILLKDNDNCHYYTKVTRAYWVVLVRKTDFGSPNLTKVLSKHIKANADKEQLGHAIAFPWPNKPVNKGLFCRTAKNRVDTYLSALKSVFERQLAPFGKSVIDATAQHLASSNDDRIFSCRATLGKVDRTDVGGAAGGRLYFLPVGLIFFGHYFTLYLPRRVIDHNTLLLAKEHDRAVDLKLTCHTTDAAWPEKDTWTSDVLWEFIGGELVLLDQGPIPLPLLEFEAIDLDHQEAIREYLDRLGLPYKACQQQFYNYKERQFMTGFMPLGD